MFDLVDLLKTDKAPVEQEEKITSVLFHQTQECKNLVEEAYRFEGISAPAVLENTDAEIRKHIRESTIEIVIVELNISDNVTEDMRQISHLLPNHASVIVIGSEDAISTIRHLKDMGFYYLFWPVTKPELIDFVRNVSDNRHRNSGLGKNRSAKKVAVVGGKGGVGASLLSVEMAYELTTKKDSNCVLVDHSFFGGNLDILLGMKRFKKRSISLGALSANLDASYAHSMTTTVNPMLSLLSVDSDELNETQLKEYTRTLSDQLSDQNNFIIEDLSRSSFSKADMDYMASECDIVVLVIEPTVSCLRAMASLVAKMETLNSTARFITVLNYTMPEKASTVSRQDVVKFLKQPIDVEFPYEPKAGELILDGKRLCDSKLGISGSIHKLTSLMLGESVVSQKSSIFKRLVKRA
ncbi:putative ATPase [Vibrio nigripulchritudo MADA3029]|uniref:AAA family ATPase n=1 Tax=Vibrio nigripulchritudo TaxID=28173 RepID=UPI0003B19940|nr:P-loop NTPase [Vibrio nigripulchritudo]CCN45598.1 putative ATPase [Vibrio nigripulchritudo MADA3020]CCN55851.1 putative ATPase [Vibrio nigripulchritudo MADA3021]CCN57075.1 putative ATPase [Vibrio nigripulchritudo MADA3029]